MVVNYLLTGVDDGEPREEALGDGLFDDLKSCADECLACNDRRQGGQNPHGVETAIRKARPEAGAVLVRMLRQIGSLHVILSFPRSDLVQYRKYIRHSDQEIDEDEELIN